MPKKFDYWKKLFDGNELKEFNNSKEGLLWLKIKSITRRNILDEFLQKSNISLNSTRLDEQFPELYNYLLSNFSDPHSILNSYIEEKNKAELNNSDIEKLVNELYKVDNFKWGADNQNDLGKYLVKKYIKDNDSYDYLVRQFKKGILETVQDYLTCSWYNHWSSILIEHIFKLHNIVLPTVGKTKSVDFFINEIPFDLKVTYLPAFFIKEERKAAGLPQDEIKSLKDAAKELNIKFNNNDANLYYSLTERLNDNGSSKAKDTLNEIRDFKINLIDEIKANPSKLAKRLYEKQSSFRFGAENRMFLVLVDKNNFDNSWKLKRNINLLKPSIHNYLDDFKSKNINDLKLSFYREGNKNKYPKKYEVLTDVLVIEN